MKELAVNFSMLENSGNFAFSGKTIGDIVNAAVPYVFIVAGITLIIYLIAGGFGYIFSQGDPKKTQSAASNMTNALIGFIIVFLAYWLVKILGTVFGIETFGNVF